MTITWTTERRKLRELNPWPRNPRQIKQPQAERLKDSVNRFGQVETLAVGPDNELYNGHQRLNVLASEYGPDYEVDVRVASRALTEKEREQLTVYLHKGAAGEWDFDILANEFEIDELVDWGFEPFELGLDDFDLDDETGDPDIAPVGSLAERFLVPPFSVLDARRGYWQQRKSAWIALGIESELGRGITEASRNDSSDYGAYDPVMGQRANAIPGGSLREAATLGKDGKTVRGDGRGRRIKGKSSADNGGTPLPLDRMKNGKGPARKHAQDLLRGEHVVGENLTWVKGNRNPNELDDTSRKNLSGGRSPHGSTPPHGPSVVQAEDGTREYRPSNGTSIFDPVLCELAYTWFCPPGGHVLDPFAGGSVRGVVASYLGRRYTGVDLRAEQIEANEAQAASIVPDAVPEWIVGNSLFDMPDITADLIFSCPPYYDLEIYSEVDGDLSNYETYADFLADYRHIIVECAARLADDRFACFVVGDIRSQDGPYRNFVSDTIAAWQDAGLHLYNEAILVTALGSLPIRAGKQFTSGRKLGKTHQNVLVFVKGDWRAAVEACGPVEVVELDNLGEPVVA